MPAGDQGGTRGLARGPRSGPPSAITSGRAVAIKRLRGETVADSDDKKVAGTAVRLPLLILLALLLMLAIGILIYKTSVA